MLKPKHLIAILTVLNLIASAQSLQAQIPEKAEFGKFAITNATIHTVANGVIENGIILINGTHIQFVGNNAKITSDFKRINATGKHVYPGFIDAGTQLGLQEIGAVAVTRDQAELGEFNPHMRAFTAINPNSVNIPVARVNGVTTVISHPVSGRISGKATLIDLYGYSPDSMAVKQDAGLVLSWPSALKRGSWDDRKEEEITKAYKQNLKELNTFIEEARFYHTMMAKYEDNPDVHTKPNDDIRLNAMRPVVAGELPIIIDVDREIDILNALEWVEKQGISNVIFSSLEEGWRVADELAKAQIPCLVGPVLDLPSRDYDHYQQAYKNPGLLQQAGVDVALRTGEVENVRNLNYNAGYAAAYGMGKEAALEAVTIQPARIFGVDDKLGSIEKGKYATLFISDGDPFEPLSTIEQVFIRGYKIPMESKHTKLYEQFLERDVRTSGQ